MTRKYKEIFSYNQDINKTAYMNWRMDSGNQIDNMISIANGYKESVFILIDKCIENNLDKKSDIIIFPILFSTNHAIELYLKSIMWSINILLDKNQKFEGKHNIYQMFNVVRSRVNEFEKDKSAKEEFKKETLNLKEYLEELNEKIVFQDGKKKYDRMDFSRYPIDTKEHKHFYIDSIENVAIDMENCEIRFKEILSELESLAGYFSRLVDQNRELETYCDY